MDWTACADTGGSKISMCVESKCNKAKKIFTHQKRDSENAFGSKKDKDISAESLFC